MTADVAGAEGRGFVVVGRAVVGLGRCVVGCALSDADADVDAGGRLGVGSGDSVGEGTALDDGTTILGPAPLSKPPRKNVVTRALPPQQSTSRPSTGRRSTTIRRRPAAG